MVVKVTVAYSYIRFSSKKQADGDSLRRQTELAENYCQRRGWTLNTATYQDLGVSAWKGTNALVGNLGEFLKAVASKAVKPGSVLIVESLDRITRQGIDEGYDLIKKLLKAGIILVTLTPEREFDESATKSLSKGALEIQLILERAAEESERKSERVAAAWRSKQKLARETGKPITKTLPLWVEVRNSKLVLIPERAAVVKRMFRLARNGYGSGLVVKALTESKVPAFTGKEWVRQYVSKVLQDRRAIGEYQPCKGRKPFGKPIKGYFPAVVTEDEWIAARAGAVQRRKMPGKVGNHVNLFAGLLRNALDGDTYIVNTRLSGHRPGHSGRPIKALVTNSYAHGRGTSLSFPLVVFERAILKRLKEIDPDTVLPSEDSTPVLDALQDQLTTVREATEKWKAESLKPGGDVPAIADVLRQLHEQERGLMSEIAEAEVHSGNPVAAAWKDTKTLLEVLDTASDEYDARLRLRSLLRRIIESIWIIVVPRSRDRLCEAQVWFAGGDGKPVGYRSYFIIYRAVRGNQNIKRPGRWYVQTTRIEEPQEFGPDDQLDLWDIGDLRKDPRMVRRIKDEMERLPQKSIERMLEEKGHVI